MMEEAILRIRIFIIRAWTVNISAEASNKAYFAKDGQLKDNDLLSSLLGSRLE